jgi:hypothetical protein
MIAEVAPVVAGSSDLDDRDLRGTRMFFCQWIVTEIGFFCHSPIRLFRPEKELLAEGSVESGIADQRSDQASENQ